MNYRHIYHAGNFADVFKHIVLVAIVQALARKEKPYCYLDTHAGIGYYNLTSPEAKKSKESATGIQQIIKSENPPKLVQDYLSAVSAANIASGIIDRYPGSPALVRHYLRPQDRMVLTELHEEDHAVLKQAFRQDKQVHVHHSDGYNALKAFLPPKERRGLVLIDPPYEKTDELNSALKNLTTAIQRWETGIYALWYPIKDTYALQRFQQQVRQKISLPYLLVELCVYPETTPTSLNGSGMLIINPPWQLDCELQAILLWLWQALSPTGGGRYTLINQ